MTENLFRGDPIKSVRHEDEDDEHKNNNSNDDDDDHKNNNDEEEPLGLADAMMMRGERLRALRRMMEEAEAEAEESAAATAASSLAETNNNGSIIMITSCCSTDMDPADHHQHQQQQDEDVCVILPSTGHRVLRYDSYLKHQRYYDDLKHVDYKYITYSVMMVSDDDHQNSTTAMIADDDDHHSFTTIAIEQDKTLGKGGLCWDAAFILAEYLLYISSSSSSSSSNTTTSNINDHDVDERFSFHHKTVLELGAGTGLCGLFLAAGLRHKQIPFISCSIELTDLPELLPILTRNVELNGLAGSSSIIRRRISSLEDEWTTADLDVLFDGARRGTRIIQNNNKEEDNNNNNNNDNPVDSAQAKRDETTSCCSARVLRWGCHEDYFPSIAASTVTTTTNEGADTDHNHTTTTTVASTGTCGSSNNGYDVILGADVVASLYDPHALAETIWDLTHASSTVWISYKGRLSEPHERFEQRLQQLFGTIQRIQPNNNNMSRNRNPQVWILKATNRRDMK